jgi:hypothetical protein
MAKVKETPEQVKVKRVIEEARRFIAAAQTFNHRVDREITEGFTSWQLKERSAMKRASMDLSRALTELRQ